MWICARSEHPWDIGHFWPLLVRFERVELRPFHLSETQALVEAAVEAGLIPPGTRNIVEWLHRRSGGSPLVLRELFEGVGHRQIRPAQSSELSGGSTWTAASTKSFRGPGLARLSQGARVYE